METASPNENTYVFDPENAAEMARLIKLDRFTTKGMGGPLAGVPELPAHAQILDLACGPGGWVLDLAFAHPDFEVNGVDVSRLMITYANARAASQQLTNATFGVMDITQPLDFDDHSFDFVNARFLIGVLKREAWAPFLAECTRILRPGGLLRLTEGNSFGISSSPSLEQLISLVTKAMWQAGYQFSPDGGNWEITPTLLQLLRMTGYSDIQTIDYAIDYSANTEHWTDYYHNLEVLFHQIKPLLLSLNLLTPTEFEQLYQQYLVEMVADDFSCTGQAITISGKTSLNTPNDQETPAG